MATHELADFDPETGHLHGEECGLDPYVACSCAPHLYAIAQDAERALAERGHCDGCEDDPGHLTAPHPCGHPAGTITHGCGGCDPGAIDLVCEDGVWRPYDDNRDPGPPLDLSPLRRPGRAPGCSCPVPLVSADPYCPVHGYATQPQEPTP